jgi:hypothetical protein
VPYAACCDGRRLPLPPSSGRAAMRGQDARGSSLASVSADPTSTLAFGTHWRLSDAGRMVQPSRQTTRSSSPRTFVRRGARGLVDPHDRCRSKKRICVVSLGRSLLGIT